MMIRLVCLVIFLVVLMRICLTRELTKNRMLVSGLRRNLSQLKMLLCDIISNFYGNYFSCYIRLAMFVILPIIYSIIFFRYN